MNLTVIATSLCMCGLRHGDDIVFREGRKLYGRALLHMAEGLRNLGEKNRPNLIMTARLLGLFEVC